MDAFDARIIREFGMDPFMAWPRRSAGLRLSEVARRLGRNVQFVKDRVGRMEEDGVIAGYHVFPNLRQCGLDFTTVLWPAAFIPDKAQLARLGAVDGFVGVFWSLDSNLCVDLTCAGAAERERRLELIGELLGMGGAPRRLFDRPFPTVGRRLSGLDWRIIRALERDARRPLSDVAEEVGVTAKTVRNRFNAMWEEGSIDTYVALDFERLSGIIPFGMSVWLEEDAPGTMVRLLEYFADRYLDHLQVPRGGYCTFQVRVFACTPAEVQALVREALAFDGVERVEPFLVTGAYYNDRWLGELLERQVGGASVLVSRTDGGG